MEEGGRNRRFVVVAAAAGMESNGFDREMFWGNKYGGGTRVVTVSKQNPAQGQTFSLSGHTVWEQQRTAVCLVLEPDELVGR